jgi:hypothetical protein
MKARITSLVLVAIVGNSCGNTKQLKKTAPDKKSGDQTALVSQFACVNAQQCPQVRLALSGIQSLGGAAESLLYWDVGATAPDDKSARQIMVVMDKDLPGMEVISKDTDLRVSVNWKPTTPETGVLQFRARDITRCLKLSGGTINCGDMKTLAPSYEQVLTAPYQVVPKNQKFDAKSSEFFRQFHCNAGIGEAAGAVIAGASAASQVIGAAVSDSNRIQSPSSLGSNIATVVDYLINGQEEPTAYECLTKNQTATKANQAQTSTLSP